MVEVARRLAPTSETVRRLFLLSGNQCAFPGCTHPIVLDDGTYVGEICHIRAAEPGGERFEPSQTNEERRSFDNLVLLCHDHHVVTDDTVAYSVMRMLEIKSQHEARFERGLAAIMESAAVQIIDSVVSLGGAGGSAPGAGGGGGGAIGPGARGGDGGQGGEHREAFFRRTDDVVALRYQVGKAGDGGTHGAGQPGEDSVVEALYRDGTVKEILRSKGGRGGASSAGRAAIKWAILANAAEIREGLIFLMGGGWRRYTVGAVPFPADFAVAFVAEPDDAQVGTVTASVVDPQGNVVTSGSLRFDFEHGGVPGVFKFMVSVTQLGGWAVVLSADDREIQRLAFEVVAQQPAASA